MQDRIKIREKGRDSGSKRETSGSGAICIQGRDGRIRESFVVSRGDFEKISAIEGLVMSAEMKRDFAAFDREGRSDAERRKAILRRYAKQACRVR